tara:strand:- start:2375 stop:2620 length:246 start_codon:yes stop_codon:yes gene_type:complete
MAPPPPVDITTAGWVGIAFAIAAAVLLLSCILFRDFWMRTWRSFRGTGGAAARAGQGSLGVGVGTLSKVGDELPLVGMRVA